MNDLFEGSGDADKKITTSCGLYISRTGLTSEPIS